MNRWEQIAATTADENWILAIGFLRDAWNRTGEEFDAWIANRTAASIVEWVDEIHVGGWDAFAGEVAR